MGQVEAVQLPEVSSGPIMARVDTGAQTSAIWASQVQKSADGLWVTFFANEAKPVLFKQFSRVMVTSSNGTAETRYKVKLLVIVAGRRIRARFTLADRSKQEYPVLIGRNVLRGKFVVDVSKFKKAIS